MKTTKARRPQPAIREARANDQQRASFGQRKTATAKSSTLAGPNMGRSTGSKKISTARQSPTSGLSKMVAQAIAKTAAAREVQGLPDASTTPETTKTVIRDSKVKTSVKRAKKMPQRQASQHEVAIRKQLREKRVTTDQLGDDRLQKVLAFSGVGSRREMEEVIEAGRVSINGKIADLGSKVSPGDEVRIDGKRVPLKWPDRLPRIIMYHKQEGELVSRDDPEGRVTVFDRLKRISSSKWVAIGRLDFNTSGLLLFTTSGELANRMMHPSFEVEREYAVRVHGQLTPEQMKQLVNGVELDDGPANFSRIEDRGGEGKNHWYHVVLKEGRNREVRRMFEHFELVVSRLMRIRFGTFRLPGRLKRGQFYELSETEVLSIMKWANLTITGTVKPR
ncbi:MULTISPECIES: 23S rRNA pseudouridine(2605) synthase RluB [Chitinibacter]|uniref:23S rRNA pseudouridine(2605) synthase RluB n=1 Tax=Chitinibacter TaxID=230666 RepID=UPI0004114D40|nr:MULTISPECIES: pseudouridine synthase [Chitinibacter]